MKYKDVNPLEKLRDGEIYFFLRAQDRIAPRAVAYYADLLKAEADRLIDSDPRKSKQLYKGALECLRLSGKMLDWQMDNDQFVKLPD